MNFTSYGNIKSIQDANGNTITINYTSGIITSVTDGAGRKITINNSNNQISSIKDAAGRTTNYTFESGILKTVTNPDGTSNSYTYDGDNALKAAIGFDGYELNFAYLTKAKGKRIFKAAEYAKDGAGNKIAGQKVGFDYSVYNTTKIDSSGVDNIYGNSDDMITTNQFDNYGRFVSSQSMASGKQLGSSLTGYTNTTNIKQINKVTSIADMGKNVNNLLLNHNVESTDKWTLLKTGTSTETVGNSTFHHYMGAKSLKIGVDNATNGSNVRYRQILSNSTVVPGKTYTISGYMKTVGLNPLVSGKEGAFLMVTCTLADGTYESYYSNYISTTTDTQINNGWRRESVAFTAPGNTVSTSVNLVLKQANGNVYFDALQLEEGETANAYNFLENASLENTDTLYGFSTSGLDGNDITAGQTVFDGKKAIKIQGDKTKLKQLSQEVAVSGTEEDTYMISGWAKAYAVPAFVADNSSSVNRRFKISVKITYTDGSEIYKSAAEFNPDVTDWQYGAVTINLSDNNAATNKTPAKLTIYPRYDNQANSVFFDNFSVIKGEILNYTYDNNGNLSSASSSPSQTSNFYHDDKNDMTNETDANHNSDLNAYDSKHNLIKTTGERGVVHKYTYNDSGNITRIIQQDKDDSPSMQIQADTVYTEDGAYVSDVSDQDGYTTKYTYHGNKGLLTSVTNAEENTTNYTYNDKNDLLTKVSAAVGEATITNAYEYNKNVLTKIIHNGFSYNFLYDEFGNNTAINVGDSTLASYEYKGVNGDLKKVNYGNGDTNSYTNDVYGNISQVEVNGTARFKWYADNTGRIARHEDIFNQLLYHYEYDLTGRLLRQGVEDMSKPANNQRTAYFTEFSYDDNNNLIKLVNQAGDKTQINGYGYTLDDLPSTYTMPTGKTVTNSYDSLNRLNQYTIDTSVPIVGEYLYSTSIRNQTGQSKYHTTKVFQETVGNTGIRYSYDKLGNIIAIHEKQADGDYTLNNSYKYDELNQLTREYDAKLNISKVYTYDLGGNIIDIKEYNTQNTTPENLRNTVTYEYADANWKDKLTSYNGQAITYDAIGNPINYKGYTLGWDNVRELASLSGNGITASYSYDADGLRTTKTVNGIKTTYQYLDGQLLYEKKGNTQLHYFYDVNGMIKGIQTIAESGEVANYYVITNTRGDVTQIYDEAGSLQVVYTYDSWGKILSVKDGSGNEITDDNNVGRLNSLRYRGYYYDEETGLYYLQSRYYDSGTCRFINTDDLNILDIEVDSMLHYNLYAYCWNNPVNMADEDGYLPWFVVAAVGGALFDTVAYLVGSAISGQKVTWAGVGKSALRGAITGVAFGALGKGVKALTTTAKATKAAKYTTGTANQVGKIGEKLAKITKNTRRYNVGGRIRIPDGMTKKFVQEVKNVKSLSLTSQLKDSMTLANSMGKRLELFIRPNTYLSGPLKRAIKSNRVKITYLW